MTPAADIILATLNARYTHCAFGLRYLFANLGDLQSRTRLLEFNIHQRPIDIAETILAHNPKILGLGIYIWNVTPSTELVSILKRLRPQLTIVLGGPEVSYETNQQPICRMADHVIPGEGDLAFAAFCRHKAIPSTPPDLTELVLPYDLYTKEDISQRILYVEASRGCPFHCEFCLSSLDTSVRQFPTDKFLAAMQRLLDRGALRFKFVDRTFNLQLPVAQTILQFFLDRYRPGLFLHLEMIPDRFPDGLRGLLQRFPPGAVQLEIGLQTFNDKVAARIGRRQDNRMAETNIRWLRENTGVHLHTDLILGLPGETLESIADGFNRLVALRPHIIQVGILKRLRGAPIGRHDAEFGMIYNPQPPYEILQNNQIDFLTMQRLWRFARYWEIVGNRERFNALLPCLLHPPPKNPSKKGNDRLSVSSDFWGTPFGQFLAFSDWLYAAVGQTHAIALPRLSAFITRYLTEEKGFCRVEIEKLLASASLRER